MKKWVVLFISMMLEIMLFGACSDSDSEMRMVNCDISDAKSLVVLPKGNIVSRAASSISSEILYKIDEDGELKSVKGTDDSGNEIEVPAPTTVIDINAEWVILSYSYASYLVNKEKGNAYIFTEQPVLLRACSGYRGYVRQSVFVDSSGNFYFLSSSGRCQKLDVSDENNVMISAYTPDVYFIGSVGEFCVDLSGNVLFSYNDEMQREVMKIKTAFGSLKNIEGGDNNRAIYSFTGYDGSLYCDGFKCTIKNDTLISESYGLSENDFRNLSHRGSGSQGLIWFYFDDSVWVTDRSMQMYAQLYNKNPAVTPSVIQVAELESEIVASVAQNSSSIFAVTGSGKIYKFDVAKGTVSKVFDNSNYEIYAFTVTDEEMIHFSAMNLQNSHKIFATVNTDGKVTVLCDDLKDDVTVLQRIK